MIKVKVEHIEAFSSIPEKGNPAGVVLNGEDYTSEQMLEIAKKAGFNETAFILPSQRADIRLRYFTPGVEMNLCGHATLGAVYCLHMKGLLEQPTITIETNAGILPISLREENGQIFITMQQAQSKFHPFGGSKADVAKAIGLKEEELDDDLPIIYGNTGNWTLIVPIKRLESFKRMEPDTERFPDVLNEIPSASVHPICLEVRDADNHMHARHFSAPASGTIEDAVTGTASAVMGAYYHQFIHPSLPLPATLKVEQGHEINKDGQVFVHLKQFNDGIEVSISGTAVYVKTIEIA
ncbi:PhzF family phenazine biosynthesis protein [Jeotgalibacillus aurantiacus]|uniref:PhzF family phenazine biosynthesis protein n=1 Tax=Jeotgalibacillus aurantiacus TaxID=2763266 RepID=UPI001D0B1C22|nr:PhzF family phenazine biosynthesis isomerase [Jeotgalibacillus aurantiacus]